MYDFVTFCFRAEEKEGGGTGTKEEGPRSQEGEEESMREERGSGGRREREAEDKGD